MFMALLGGTTTGKTFHFGPDGVLLRGLREALGERSIQGLRPVLSVEVSPVPGGGRGSTLTMDYYGASIDLYPSRETLGWMDLPGQDYIVSCPVYRRMAEHGASPPGDPGGLLEEIWRAGDPASIVEGARDIMVGLYRSGLLPGELLSMGFYSIYTDLAPDPERLIETVDYSLSSLAESLSERSLEEERHAWALLNSTVFHAINALAGTVRRDLERRHVGSRVFLKILRAEQVLAETLARAFLERATGQSAGDLYPMSLPHDTGTIKACAGPGCPQESWPHREAAATLQEVPYTRATAHLMEHQALLAGGLAGLLVLELARKSRLHAIAHPADAVTPSARYLERVISMRSGPSHLETIRRAATELLGSGCQGEATKRALDAARRAAIESVTPVQVITALAQQECGEPARADAMGVLSALSGGEARGCESGEHEALLSELAKHYTYTGPFGDLLVSHTRSIELAWRLAGRPRAVLVVLTYSDEVSRRSGVGLEELARLSQFALMGDEDAVRMLRKRGVEPFPLRLPGRGVHVAVVPGGAYGCCRSGLCNPAVTIGYLSSVMAVVTS